MNDTPSLSPATNDKKKISRVALIISVIAFIGFLDALYLSANSLLGITPPCFVSQGCDIVTTSEYSDILGIPVAIFGAVYYLALFFTALSGLFDSSRRKLKIIFAISGVGFLFTLWLVYAQIFIIEAICTYCMLSAVTTTAIFATSSVALRKK